MRYVAPLLLALGMFACSPSDQDRARADAEHAREKTKAALRDAKNEAQKAGKEIDRELENARVKTRKAINDATGDHK